MLLLCLVSALVVAGPCTAFTDPEGFKLLEDLRNFKGEHAPQSWAGTDPCGSQWQGVECSSDGHVINVALQDWLPQRQLLQTLTEEEEDIIQRAAELTGTVGNINSAIGNSFPAGSDGASISSSYLNPTISAIKSGLEGLLPFIQSPSPSPGVPAPQPSSLTIRLAPTLTPAIAPSMSPTSEMGISPMGSARPLPVLAPNPAASSSGLPQLPVNPGQALSDLLSEIEAIKEKLEMEANNGRRRLAQEDPAPMGTPAMGPATQPLPVIPTVTSTSSSVSPAPGPESSPIMEAKVAPAPMGVDPTLLPQGYTDIQDLQAAVGNDKGIGRRLAATTELKFSSPASAPAFGPASGPYQERLAPETAPAGLGGPSSERSVITPNLDGSVDVKLGEASVGGFTLPSVTGKVPSQPGVKINYGRRLMAEPLVKPKDTLLDFPEPRTDPRPDPLGPAMGMKSQGPAAGPAGGYKEKLAPKSAPMGVGGPEGPGFAVKLPSLQVGPIKLPPINTNLPEKEELPGRKRLQEVQAPMSGMGPMWGPAEGPWSYSETLAPESAPKGEGSPGGFVLPGLDFGKFKLPELNFPKPPPKDRP